MTTGSQGWQCRVKAMRSGPWDGNARSRPRGWQCRSMGRQLVASKGIKWKGVCVEGKLVQGGWIWQGAALGIGHEEARSSMMGMSEGENRQGGRRFGRREVGEKKIFWLLSA